MFESVFFSQWKGKDYYLLLIPLIPVIIHSLIVPVQVSCYILNLTNLTYMRAKISSMERHTKIKFHSEFQLILCFYLKMEA